MLRRLLRLFRRPRDLVCRTCGFTVPYRGSKWEQASIACEHYFTVHDTAEPRYYPNPKGNS